MEAGSDEHYSTDLSSADLLPLRVPTKAPGIGRIIVSGAAFCPLPTRRSKIVDPPAYGFPCRASSTQRQEDFSLAWHRAQRLDDVDLEKPSALRGPNASGSGYKRLPTRRDEHAAKYWSFSKVRPWILRSSTIPCPPIFSVVFFFRIFCVVHEPMDARGCRHHCNS